MAAHFLSQPNRISSNQRGDYLQAIQEWNSRLIEAQRSIRILESVRWPDHVQREFFRCGGRELPLVARNDYRSFSATEQQSRLDELRSIEHDVRSRLGNDPAARLLIRRCRSYQDALRLIAARGTPRFCRISREIYGSARSGSRESLTGLVQFLEASAPCGFSNRTTQPLPASEAAKELSGRLGAYFANLPVPVRIREQLASDACAGTRYLKLRQAACFTGEDIHLLEVHEGWAHLGTAFNGARQPVLTVLSRTFPGATPTQEGLAVLTEFAAGACHPQRRQRLALRLRAVIMAEDGADFLDVYRFLLDRGAGEIEAYRSAARVFRGSLPKGAGPFTKDLSYGLGLLALVRKLRTRSPGDRSTIPLLFSGKTHGDELNDLAEFHGRGLLVPGEFIPTPLLDRPHLDKVLAALPV